jgi:hypothetical protein
MQEMAAVMAQVQLLRSQLESHQLGQEEQVDGGDDAPMNMRGRGCQFSNDADPKGTVVVSVLTGVGESPNSFGGIAFSSPNNFGAGQGNGASPMVSEALNSHLFGTLANNPRATPLGGVVHVPSNVSDQVYVRPGWMLHDNIVPQEEVFGPKANKKVMRVISNPSHGSF